MQSLYTKEFFKQRLTENLLSSFDIKPENASDEMFYKAAAMTMRDILMEKRKNFMAKCHSNGKKQINYLCMEFLLGRSLKNSAYNLKVVKELSAALSDFGVKLENLYECEPDAGLGNGGLGRLAACFMDALASLDYPATGYSILYEFGIFKQKLLDGWQTELPDNWLPGGDVWLTPKYDLAVPVHFGGRVDEFWDNNYHHVNYSGYQTVMAVPYDMYISGYDCEGVSLLRLWKAQSSGMDMDLFNRGDYEDALRQNSMAEVISKVLYPNDSHMEGKELRLKQQYFLVCASVGDIVNNHMAVYGTLDNFADKVAIHINDTHPTLAIPELMRILLDDCGYGWDQAWDIVTKTFGYTNHTVMSEALEKWNEDLFKSLLPRIYQIVVEINRRFCKELFEKYHLDVNTINRMSIIDNHQIKMANLCVWACHSVNGVSQLHSEIIKEELFHDFYNIEPAKFKNVTNGIASRRWLYQSNPELTKLISSLIGDGFIKDMSKLELLKPYANDKEVLKQLSEVKYKNKERFSNYVNKNYGISVDPNAIFDVQVKRLHEYKRQHLNALHILSLYRYLLENPNAAITPKTFIFGAKAAPGYYLAKQIIKLLCTMSKEIKQNKRISEMINIVFLEDYRVTLSEILTPASEISEQISLAGTEASGTGNMKLMLNGAITLGTMDGANVEIYNAVGPDNIIIFGMSTPEVEKKKAEGYRPIDIYNSNAEIKGCIDMLFSGIGGNRFEDIGNSLKNIDQYMVLADFNSYKLAHNKADMLYADKEKWNKMSLINIAGSGYFCADRSIQDYARDIWGL